MDNFVSICASISTFVSIGSVCIKIKRWFKPIQMSSNMHTKLEIEVQIDPNWSKNWNQIKWIKSSNYQCCLQGGTKIMIQSPTKTPQNRFFRGIFATTTQAVNTVFSTSVGAAWTKNLSLTPQSHFIAPLCELGVGWWCSRGIDGGARGDLKYCYGFSVRGALQFAGCSFKWSSNGGHFGLPAELSS